MLALGGCGVCPTSSWRAQEHHNARLLYCCGKMWWVRHMRVESCVLVEAVGCGVVSIRQGEGRVQGHGPAHGVRTAHCEQLPGVVLFGAAKRISPAVLRLNLRSLELLHRYLAECFPTNASASRLGFGSAWPPMLMRWNHSKVCALSVGDPIQ